MVRDCVAALLKYDTPDSITKAFCILNGFLSCGRSSEIAFVVLEELIWDPLFSAVFMGIPQIKVVQDKEIAIATAVSRHMDWGQHMLPTTTLPLPFHSVGPDSLSRHYTHACVYVCVRVHLTKLSLSVPVYVCV